MNEPALRIFKNNLFKKRLIRLKMKTQIILKSLERILFARIEFKLALKLQVNNSKSLLNYKNKSVNLKEILERISLEC